MSEIVVELWVNGVRRHCRVDGRRRLLDLLRDDLELTGTKECCGTGDCGACTVLLDGRPINSCILLAGAATGHRVETIEGLRDCTEMAALARSFAEGGAVQCGFCTPGMLVTATVLLRERREITERDARHFLAGNLCRCTGYPEIIEAVLRAGATLAQDDSRRASGGAPIGHEVGRADG